MLDQMLDGESRGVDLLAHLHLIAAVDEDHGAVGEHDGEAGRAGEAGEPGQPLGAGRHIFVLIAVGARHDEAVEPAPLELARASAATRGAVAPRVAAIVERLEMGFEHGGNLKHGGGRGNRFCREMAG